MTLPKFGLLGTMACLVASLGCAQLAEMTGMNEMAIPAGATVEAVIHTDEAWKALAVNKPLGNVNARSDVKQRWASPNYGTRDWLPAIAGGGIDPEEWEEFRGSKWVWYAESEFTFGGVNSIPGNRKVVHLRREFYNADAAGDLVDTYLDVMTSGNISVQVFVNGSRLRLDMGKGDVSEETQKERARRARRNPGTPDMVLFRYGFGEYLLYGKNVIGIQATTHLENNVNGRPVKNYVRDGVIAKVTVQ
jgi:hypothetical protein